jgi:NAD(P)-dependent dehydrogenase (short-subunit alcohol dehydrogenase family)
MVIAGATGGIGSQLLEHFDAASYDPRKQEYPTGHDIFINCIGYNVDGMSHKIRACDFREVIDINLNLAFEMTQHALQDMRSRSYGRIIHLSSMLSTKTVVGTCAYSASKAGLNAMVRVMGEENRTKNVLINSLNLGYIDAGMTHKLDGIQGASIQEVIRACEMLIDSDLITGKNIDIW